MSKRHSAKYKIDRRMGENLWGRAKSPVNKRSYGPGQHGQRRKSKVSDFGLQLKAKQKLKGYYGNITEKQFSAIYAEAGRRKGNTSENLIGLLESRLDALVYRAKFVPTVWAARQFVVLCHKHGWTPVRVAHSGSETQHADPQTSGAVMCLAAIFVAGGENEVRAKSAALSALKSLRSRFTYLEWPDCLPDDPLHDTMEPTEYTASLKELISDRHNGIGVLSEFHPGNY